MKGRKKLCLLVMVLASVGLTVSCSENIENTKPMVEQEEVKEKIVINPPCLPDTNTFQPNGFKSSFEYTYFSNRGRYGEYSFTTSNSNGELEIDFDFEPDSGVYVTTNELHPFNRKSNECIVGIASGFYYQAVAGDSVYVRKNENGYDVIFCNLNFEAVSENLSFNSYGRIVVEL